MSFLQRLKARQVHLEDSVLNSAAEKKQERVVQLDFDVYMLDGSIIAYSQIPGVSMSDINITIEGEANIVIIEGHQSNPGTKKDSQNNCLTAECVWGNFYRKVILPVSVDIEGCKASLQNGVLMLCLPILKLDKGGVKMTRKA